MITPAQTAGETTPETTVDETEVKNVGESVGLSSTEQLQEIVTPVKVDRLDRWLEGYDENERQYLIDGFSNGFSIACEEVPNASGTAEFSNHNSAKQHPEVLRELIMEEVQKGRIAGPFNTKPFPNLHISPLSLREKKEKNKFRLIHDLSHPHGDSVNNGISDEQASVSYETLDTAIKHIQNTGKDCFLAKTDIKGAFRIIPVRPADRLLLGMEVDGKFYFDKCLAMGCRSSCKIFESFSRALQWICQNKLGIKIMVHVLDDFLLINFTDTGCQDDLDKFIKFCIDIGVPLAPEKTLGPYQVLVFLGIEVDTTEMVSRLPQEKIEKCMQEIKKLMPTKVKKIRLRQLQSVIGLLNFACKVVSPGRAFLRRLIDRTCNVKSKFHYVRLNQEDKEDLKMWLKFLGKFNGICMFHQLSWFEAPDLHLYTDASKIGYGAVLKTQWLAGKFPQDCTKLNITVLELFPIFLALNVWGNELRNKKLRIHTDNLDLVHVINKKTSREKAIMPLVRELVLVTLKGNILLHAVHIAGVDNNIADALSRFQFQRFRSIAPHMDEEPVMVPSHLLPSVMLNT